MIMLLDSPNMCAKWGSRRFARWPTFQRSKVKISLFGHYLRHGLIILSLIWHEDAFWQPWHVCKSWTLSIHQLTYFPGVKVQNITFGTLSQKLPDNNFSNLACGCFLEDLTCVQKLDVVNSPVDLLSGVKWQNFTFWTLFQKLPDNIFSNLAFW